MGYCHIRRGEWRTSPYTTQGGQLSQSNPDTPGEVIKVSMSAVREFLAAPRSTPQGAMEDMFRLTLWCTQCGTGTDHGTWALPGNYSGGRCKRCGEPTPPFRLTFGPSLVADSVRAADAVDSVLRRDTPTVGGEGDSG